MSSDDAALHRYEDIYRVIRRTSNRGLLLCLAATGILAVVYVTWLARPFAQALTGIGLPPWTVAGVQAAASISVLLTLPNLTQFIVIHGDTKAAMEAFNTYAFAELRRRQQEGVHVPTFRSAAQIEPWIAVHAEVGGSVLVRLMTWAGDYDSSRRALARMQPATAADTFEVDLLRAMVQFVETGNLDLHPAERALIAVTGIDRDWARLALAFEQARADNAVGLPWQLPFARARGEVRIPLAATFLGRLLASVRAYATITLIITTAAILFTIVR